MMNLPDLMITKLITPPGYWSSAIMRIFKEIANIK
jgi:hypothetical protein